MSTVTQQDREVEDTLGMAQGQVQLLVDLNRYLAGISDVERANMTVLLQFPMSKLEDLLEGAYQSGKTANIKFAKAAISIKVLQEQDLI